MDPGYDTKGAAKKLEIHALERLNSPHSGVQISRFASVTARYEVVSTGNVKRLVNKEVDPTVTCEEVTARFQGIICRADLPPFTERLRSNSTQARYLRQSITVTGLDSPTFQKIVNSAAEIHAVLGRAVGMEKMDGCGFIASYRDMPALELSNKYLTPRNSHTEAIELGFSADIDPHGYLAQAAGTNFYHSEENAVAYFERNGTCDENYRYSPAKPVIFGIGDIVEIQTSFMAIPLKEGKYKSLMVLRGLTLIDGTYTQNARVQQLTMRSNMKAQALKTTFKRKVGYFDEEVSVARAKMGRMEIDAPESAPSETAEKLNNMD